VEFLNVGSPSIFYEGVNIHINHKYQQYFTLRIRALCKNIEKILFKERMTFKTFPTSHLTLSKYNKYKTNLGTIKDQNNFSIHRFKIKIIVCEDYV